MVPRRVGISPKSSPDEAIINADNWMFVTLGASGLTDVASKSSRTIRQRAFMLARLSRPLAVLVVLTISGSLLLVALVTIEASSRMGNLRGGLRGAIFPIPAAWTVSTRRIVGFYLRVPLQWSYSWLLPTLHRQVEVLLAIILPSYDFTLRKYH